MKKVLHSAFLVLIFALLCSCELMYKAPEKGKLRVFIYANDYKYGYTTRVLNTIDDGIQTGLCLTALAEATDTDCEVYYFLGKDADDKRAVIPVSDKVTVSNDVTLGAFVSKIDEVSGQVGSRDMTVFFFSCHGSREDKSTLPYGTDTSADSFIVFNNAMNNDFEFLTVKYMKEKICSLSGTKVVFADFCHSGAFVDSSYVSVNYGEYSGMTPVQLLGHSADINVNPSFFCLSAARYYQESYESGQHGYFTKALLDGLGWDEENGRLTASPVLEGGAIHLLDLAAYVRENDNEGAGHTQTPMFSGGSNDLVLFSFR